MPRGPGTPNYSLMKVERNYGWLLRLKAGDSIAQIARDEGLYWKAVRTAIDNLQELFDAGRRGEPWASCMYCRRPFQTACYRRRTDCRKPK